MRTTQYIGLNSAAREFVKNLELVNWDYINGGT